ncbi:MAG: sigma-70 family RNA polymerase sigma factor [Planctomycetia bacterium]|nr:sigma-70 family RNA polymerase sigma factor [Planctomycetia bacterium]
MLLATAEPFTDPAAAAVAEDTAGPVAGPPAPRRHGNAHDDANGRDAALKLFRDNERLAYHVARSFQPSAKRLGLCRDDLMQAALLGLWLACQRFNPALGWKFSTFGYRGVLTHCQRALYTARRQDSEWALPQDCRQTPDGLSILDLVAAPAEDPAGDQAEARERLRPLLAALPDRLRRVVELRWGLDGEGERALAEVGAVLGVSRERVRQLELKAFKLMLRARRVAVERAAAWQPLGGEPLAAARATPVADVGSVSGGCNGFGALAGGATNIRGTAGNVHGQRKSPALPPAEE